MQLRKILFPLRGGGIEDSRVFLLVLVAVISFGFTFYSISQSVDKISGKVTAGEVNFTVGSVLSITFLGGL